MLMRGLLCEMFTGGGMQGYALWQWRSASEQLTEELFLFSLFNVVLLLTFIAMRWLLPRLCKLSVLGLSFSLNKIRSKTSVDLGGQGRELRLHCACSCWVKSFLNCPSKPSLCLELLRTRSCLPLKTKQTSFLSNKVRVLRSNCHTVSPH